MSGGLWKTQAHKVSRATHDCIKQHNPRRRTRGDSYTPPRQATEASIDKHTVDIKPTRKKKSPLKIKKRGPIGRPWE